MYFFSSRNPRTGVFFFLRNLYIRPTIKSLYEIRAARETSLELHNRLRRRVLRAYTHVL